MSIVFRATLTLAFAALACACGRELQSSSTLEPSLHLGPWRAQFPPVACWLAVAEAPVALEAAWPALAPHFPGVEDPATLESAWIAVEMASLPASAEQAAWREAALRLEERDELEIPLGEAEQWLREWVPARRRFTELSSTAEALLAAAFAQPETRDAFLPLLHSRGIDPATATPELVGGTLTSAEMAMLEIAIVRRIAAMSPEQRDSWCAAMGRTLAGLRL